MTAIRVLVGLLGAVVVLGVVMSAMRTVVLPRGEPVRLTAMVFSLTRRAFDLLLRTRSDFAAKDRLMALYAPVTLLMLPFVWLPLAWLGFAAIFWALEQGGVEGALVMSGSSLVTLGFDRPETMPGLLLSFVEGTLAMSVLALLLVTYLPSMYSAFSDREEQVALFEVRGGTPPSPVEMMIRYHLIRGLDTTESMWEEWERWFAKISESHTSLPALAFFRSPDPRQSWVTTGGAVMDAAAMMLAVIDLERVDGRARDDAGPAATRMPSAATCIRAGFLALRHIADHFGLPYDPDPAHDDPISVTREEFDDACATMAEAGVPLRPDLNDAWVNWAGWRVNYDAVLLQLAQLTVAPPAPWTSDREPVGLPPSTAKRTRVFAALRGHGRTPR